MLLVCVGVVVIVVDVVVIVNVVAAVVVAVVVVVIVVVVVVGFRLSLVGTWTDCRSCHVRSEEGGVEVGKGWCGW